METQYRRTVAQCSNPISALGKVSSTGNYSLVKPVVHTTQCKMMTAATVECNALQQRLPMSSTTRINAAVCVRMCHIAQGRRSRGAWGGGLSPPKVRGWLIHFSCSALSSILYWNNSYLMSLNSLVAFTPCFNIGWRKMKRNICIVHMQALHRKLDVVLVQILPYNCSETD